MEEKKKKKPSEVMGVKVWFTSDTHVSHKNILKHCPGRAEAGKFDIDDVEAHDKWIIDVWNSTIGKRDIVYILGDFSFASPDIIKKQILPKLNGQKYLILGNHDKSSEHLQGYFTQITQMKEAVFKRKNFPFIEEDSFRVFMCHYPMVTWEGKQYGVVQIHGHCHGRLDGYNEKSIDLRVDVGIDGKLADFKPVSLDELYKYFKKKTGGKDIREYATLQRKYYWRIWKYCQGFFHRLFG
jgi:calcineurin-like phosphoesterase family protein